MMWAFLCLFWSLWLLLVARDYKFESQTGNDQYLRKKFHLHHKRNIPFSKYILFDKCIRYLLGWRPYCIIEDKLYILYHHCGTQYYRTLSDMSLYTFGCKWNSIYSLSKLYLGRFLGPGKRCRLIEVKQECQSWGKNWNQSQWVSWWDFEEIGVCLRFRGIHRENNELFFVCSAACPRQGWLQRRLLHMKQS